MNYDLSTNQKLLKDAAREFFSKELNTIMVREMARETKYSEEIWKKMAEMGWMGILIPEQYAEFEMSFLDLAMLLYEMGYACFSSPYFATAVLGAIIILEAGDESQKKSILPKVATGDQILTLAWNELDGTYSPSGILTKANIENENYMISGTKVFVPYAHVADKIICVARTENFQSRGEEGISLFIVDRASKGLDIELTNTIAEDKQCEVNFNRVKVPKENLVGEHGQSWNILKNVLLKAAIAKCAEMSGGAQKVLEMVVEHAKKREQFGRPIGSFQAIQHHCADILTYVDTSKFMTYQACWRIKEGLSFEKEASMCKAWVSESYHQIVSLGHQVMGGLGFMEVPPHG